MGNSASYGENNMNIRIFDPNNQLRYDNPMHLATISYYHPSPSSYNFNDIELKNMVTNIKKIVGKNPTQFYERFADNERSIVYNKTNCNCDQLKDVFKEYEEKSGMKISCCDY